MAGLEEGVQVPGEVLDLLQQICFHGNFHFLHGDHEIKAVNVLSEWVFPPPIAKRMIEQEACLAT